MRSWLPILTTGLAVEIYTTPLNYARRKGQEIHGHKEHKNARKMLKWLSHAA